MKFFKNIKRVDSFGKEIKTYPNYHGYFAGNMKYDPADFSFPDFHYKWAHKLHRLIDLLEDWVERFEHKV